MASPPPPHHHTHHHHHHHPSFLPAIPSGPCCCCCFVRRILLHHQHHHFHHQLFHTQGPPLWAPHGSPHFLVPRPGVCSPHTLSRRGDQRGVTAQDAVEPGEGLTSSKDVSSNRLQQEAWAQKFEDEIGGEEEEEEEEAVYVLTDEWAELFAKSEAKRQLERKQKKQQQKGGI